MNALAELISALHGGDYRYRKLDPEFILSEMEVGTIMMPSNIIWADIECWGVHLHLPTGYSVAELKDFLVSLGTIDYDEGFGTQELFGVVVLTNGEWLERGEYDGSEWWEDKSCPKEEYYLDER